MLENPMAFKHIIKLFLCIENYSIIPAVIILCSIGPSAAYAHNVSVFAWVAGDTVHVVSNISGGKKPKNAPVGVYNSQGKLLLEGKTNESGEFSFKIPQKTEMRIVLEVGHGHQAQWLITEADLAAAGVEQMQFKKPSISDTKKPDSGAHFRPGKQEPDSEKSPESREAMTVEEIQIVVEEALDRKLKPIMKMLADSREKGLRAADILGGIGYILGLIGIASYFHYRKKATDRS
jgi:nickel transport protein